MNAKRILYLDQIRGLMILWMLVVHISLNYGYIKFGEPVTKASVFTMMSFFMTPFYVFSGYLFSDKRNFSDYTKNKIKKLIIPYFFFTLLGLIIYEAYYLIVYNTFDLNFVAGFISTASFKSNTPCWFFVSLFFVTEIYYLLHKKLGGAKIRFAILTSFVFALLSSGRIQVLCSGNILLGLVYFHIGYIIKTHEEKIKQYYYLLFSVALITYLIIGLLFPTSLSFVLNNLNGGHYVTNFVFSMCACLILFLLFFKIPQTGNVVENLLGYLGRTSLVIFAFHRPVLNWIFEPLLKWVAPDISYQSFLLICLCLILISAFLFNKVVGKTLPFVIGK